MKSVLQDWIGKLGLRHQGVLLTAIRGCDTAPKDDASKMFTRCYRDVVLNPFVGDATKSASFIERVSPDELDRRFNAFRKNLDHYPHHYVMHVIHAIQIIGYKHPADDTAEVWRGYYLKLCNGIHCPPEPEQQMDSRLNASEEMFGAEQKS